VGQPPGTSLNVTSYLRDKRIQQSVKIDVSRNNPVHISASILTATVYFDDPIARIAFQVRDRRLNVATIPTVIYVSIGINNNGSCTSDPVSGICVASIPITNFSSLMSVFYGFNVPQTFAGAVSYVARQQLMRYLNFYDTIVALYPSRHIVSGETIDVPVYAYAKGTIGAFSVEVNVVDFYCLQLVDLIVSNTSMYLASKSLTALNGTISAVPLRPLIMMPPSSPTSTQARQLLFTARFLAIASGSAFVTMQASQLLLVDGLMPVMNSSTLSLRNRFRVNAFEGRNGRVAGNAGNITIIDNFPAALFGALADGVGEVVNALPLYPSPLWKAIPITVYGVYLYPPGRISSMTSGVLCSSSNTSVAEVSQLCSNLLLSRGSVSGSSLLYITMVTTGFNGLRRNTTGTIPITVWTASLASLEARVQFPTLYALSGYARTTTSCSAGSFMSSRIWIAAKFFAGDSRFSNSSALSFTADVTSSVLSLMTVDSSTVVAIDNSTSVVVGKMPGRAIFSYAALSFAVNVSSNFIVVNSISVNLASGIFGAVSTAANDAVVSAVAVVTSSVSRDDESFAVVAFANITLNGLMYLIDAPSDVVLSTNMSGVLNITTSNMLIVNPFRQPRNYIVGGSVVATWSTCQSTSLRSVSGMSFIQLSLSQAVLLTLELSETTLAEPASAAAAAGVATQSQVIAATLQFPFYSRSVLGDPLLTFNMTGASNLLNISRPETSLIYFLPIQGSANRDGMVLARYPGTSAVSLTFFTVVSAVALEIRVDNYNSNQSRQLGLSGRYPLLTIISTVRLSTGVSLNVLPTVQIINGPGIAASTSQVVSTMVSTISIPQYSVNSSFALRSSFSGLSTFLNLSIVTTPEYPDTMLSVSVALLPTNIVLFRTGTLSGVVGSLFQLLLSMMFPSTFVLDLISPSTFATYPNIVGFNSTATSAVVFDTTSGQFTLLGNAPDAITFTVYSLGSSFVHSFPIFCNLLPAVNDVDLGVSSGAPVTAILGINVTVPVTINLAQAIAGFAFKVGQLSITNLYRSTMIVPQWSFWAQLSATDSRRV
jgi:hypothetical protein